MKKISLNPILSKLDLHPVLVDIGASGTPPQIWEDIAQQSIYVGFDPDLRELHELSNGQFYKATIVNKAVTADKAEEALFYFTNSPYCSSTLLPDAKSLADYIFSDLFIVERKGKVQAASLDKVLELLSLPRIDWLKTDSQGTDLRIFQSLPQAVRSHVLALDIEPGLIDAYIGEDLFVDAHRELVRDGFWLSNLAIQGTVRTKKSTLSELLNNNQGITYDLLQKTLKVSPGWCEARYLRRLDWLAQHNFVPQDYVLLWVFALLDNQIGFALDVAFEYERLFGKDELSQTLRNEPVLQIKKNRTKLVCTSIKSFPFRLARLISRLWNR